MRIEELVFDTAFKLRQSGIESAKFEAKQMVAAASRDKMSFEKVTDGEVESVRQMLLRRQQNEPLQYILGEWEFYGLPFKVGEGVLIPRSDTETLVSAVLKLRPEGKKVFDLCAGSGCIGITLAKLGNAEVTMFEKSPKALKYLKENIELNGVTAAVKECDVLCEVAAEKVDFIVSNPPYIATEVIDTLSAEVKKEPKMALDGGEDGLLFYRHIAKEWKSALNDGGHLVFEIGFDQAEAVMNILTDEGFSDIQCIKDLCLNDRVVLGTYKIS